MRVRVRQGSFWLEFCQVGRKQALKRSPLKLWDYCLESEAYIQLNTALNCYELQGKVPETILSGQQFDDAPEDETDPILDYINGQHHQEQDMNNALQAYNVMASPTPADTPQGSVNLVHTHLFYHVTQHKQAQHGSLVDRGANGGLEDLI